MERDLLLKNGLSDNDRYADLLNGFLFGGKQRIRGEDLTELDTQTGLRKGIKRKKDRAKYRDLFRKAAFGVNFAVIGVENQEEVHYLMPLRSMAYDVAEYEKQARQIKKRIRKRKNISSAEFLSGFGKDSRLHPCVTIVLYFGKDWDGGRELHEIIDFTDIPEDLKKYVGNYRTYVLEVRKWENTNVFQTDLKLIFDFIRCADDRKKLYELVTTNPAYQEMDEDAYDMATAYADASELISTQKYYREDGKINMCEGLRALIEEGRQEGWNAGREEKDRIIISNVFAARFSDEDICALVECDRKTLDIVKKNPSRR